MARDLEIKVRTVAALEVGALLLLASAAFAAPPQQHLVQAPTQHLDLRLPSHAAEGAGDVAEKSPNALRLRLSRRRTPAGPRKGRGLVTGI